MVSYRFLAMKDRKRYIKPDQVEKLINYYYEKAENSERSFNQFANLRKAYLIYTLWRTGRRISEIVGDIKEIDRIPGLRPMDFDWDNKEITFSILKKFPVRSKTKSGNNKSEDKIKRERFHKKKYEEIIVYDDEYFESMKAFIEKFEIPGHERIFPLHPKYVASELKVASENLKLNLGYKTIIDDTCNKSILKPLPINAHSFRHGFSINFLKENNKNPMALPALQEILCHSSINVTKTYLRFNQEDKRELLNKAQGIK